MDGALLNNFMGLFYSICLLTSSGTETYEYGQAFFYAYSGLTDKAQAQQKGWAMGSRSDTYQPQYEVPFYRGARWLQRRNKKAS